MVPDDFDIERHGDLQFHDARKPYPYYQYKSQIRTDPHDDFSRWVSVQNGAWRKDMSRGDGYTTWNIVCENDPAIVEEFLCKIIPLVHDHETGRNFVYDG